MMNFGEERVEVHELKEELIPHFALLDHNVQKEIVHILQLLVLQPDKKQLQQFSRLGHLEEAPLLRSHIWKLLLDSLPLNPQLWRRTKKTNLQLYRSLTDKFMGRYVDEDDLLNIKDTFDEALWNQIELDTRRTHSALNFFQKSIDHTTIYLQRPTKNSDVLSRILYIWGKINPTVRYVQGMNEILAPLYYLQFQRFAIDSQSQVFFMFSALMTFLIDMHIKDMDDSQHGISGRMRMLNRFLKVVDFQLWNRLDREKILPQYYSFRWLALLLAQQFGLYQTMKLWDVMLSFEGYKRYFFLYSCCIAILKYRKTIIMTQQFANVLPAIQKLRDIALKLYEKYGKVNIQKLYLRINQKIERQKEEQISKKKEEEEGKKWNYAHVMQRTSNFLAKFKFNGNK